MAAPSSHRAIEQINVKVSAQFNSNLRGLADREGF